MKRKISIGLISILLVGGLVLQGCDYEDSTAGKEQALTEKNQERLLENQPPVSLDHSLERENINKRTELWNDSAKISYIYLMSYGKVVAFYTIKGKVSSVNSQVTNPSQLAEGRYDSNEYVIPSPAEDGSYGTNGDGIFFFTTENVYVEWSGEYLLVDQPLKITTPVALTREVK